MEVCSPDPGWENSQGHNCIMPQTSLLFLNFISLCLSGVFAFGDVRETTDICTLFQPVHIYMKRGEMCCLCKFSFHRIRRLEGFECLQKQRQL